MNEKDQLQTELIVEGMNCNNCALGIRRQLEKDGFKEVYVNFSTDEVRFVTEPEARIAYAIKKINALGYKARIEKDDEPIINKGLSTIEKKFYFSLIFTIPLLAVMFIRYPLLHNPWFQLILTIPVFALGLFHFGKSAVSSLRSGIPNMDVLIILGSSAAFIYSLTGTIKNLGHDYQFYETTATIISLIFLGNMLEHLAVKKTTSAINELVKLQRSMAVRLTKDANGNETTEEIEAKKIRRTDILLVNTGEKIPTDGEITWGAGSIDESMISGESVPVDKITGDKVIGGTMLLAGSVKIKATAIGNNTVLAQIIELVKQAQQDKPAIQNLADKISAVFVPVVVCIAIITFLISHFAIDMIFQDALMHSIAVLVIACPCALGLAIPTAVVVGVGRVAKSGVLIKGASTIQKFMNIKQMVFDKTGTLTTGNFIIKNTQCFNKSEEDVKRILFSLEKHSAHPIAQSLVKELKESFPLDLSNFKEEKGIGISASDATGNIFKAGSYQIAKEQSNDNTHQIYLFENNSLIATVDIEDEIKPDIKPTLDYLRSKGIITILLSGDRKEKCESIARTLGIEFVYSEKLPYEKLAIIEQLSKESDTAMVGDGINDAPALAKATIGISLSTATQVAIQSAQIILLKGNISLLRKTYGISRITLLIIKQNLFWAFFYNVIAIPIAAVGLLDPMIAAASMALSDVIVVLNSLRLRNKKLD